MTPEKALEIRKKLDLSQKEMGEKIGVVWQSISGYENGKPIPDSIENLYKLISEYEEIKGLLKRIEHSILE